MTRRHRAVISVLALTISLAPTTLPSATVGAAAAQLTLTEVAGTPYVVGFNGWNLGFATNSIFSSPAVVDVTGDGSPEIIVGNMNSAARVFNLANGSVHVLDPGGANLSTGHGATQASPTIGDLNGDGVNDVVIANTGGRLAGYSLKNNVVTPLFNHYVAPAFNGAIDGLFGTPALGYINGDGSLDMVTSTWGQLLDVWTGPTAQRQPQMQQWLRDTIWSSPVIGDISGTGVNSIVVGGDCDGSGVPQPCYGIGKGGYVWAFNLDGTLKWKYFVRDAVVWSTPALVDLNNDGALDIVVGTGLYFLGPAANKIFALDGKTGSLMWEAPTGGPVLGSPAVARVNGAARVWVVSGGGNLMSFNQNGSLLWQQCITDGTCSSGAGTFGGVSIADIDNDGTLDAVVQAEQKMKVLNALTGAVHTTVRSAYPHTLFASYATPTIAQVNGKTWIVQVNIGDQNGNITRDGGDALVVSVWTTGTALGAAPWPTFKANWARTGGETPAPPDRGPTDNFVNKAYQDFLGRAPTQGERDYWSGRLIVGTSTRADLMSALSTSTEWLTYVISSFYLDTLNRPPDPAGLAGWINAAKNGMPIAQIAAAFYASPEYFQTVGKGDPRIWIGDLYKKLLLREADSGGLDGWVSALNAGMPRDVVAFGFYQSPEKLGIRVAGLYTKLLERAPEPGAREWWSPFVARNGDLVLAAALGTADEYFALAQDV